MATTSSNVVSLKDHRMANPKRAILEFRGLGKIIVICSPDKRDTFLSYKTDEPLSPVEFDDLVSEWKAKHPNCECIDF